MLLELNLVCQTTSYGANHSQAQGLRSVLWVKSLKKNSKQSVNQTLSSVKKSLKLVLTVISGNTSLSRLAVRSVGVMGDGRTYDYTIAIRAITSIDGMTADFAKIPWEVLQKISVRIVNEVDHVNRIVYDITSKPPATVEWE